MNNEIGTTPASLLALGCIGFLATAPAFAATADDESDEARSAIVVTGQRDRTLQGPKAIAPLLDTPRSIVVVDKQVIRETGSATLVEALRTVPGITFGAAEGGNPIGDRPFIRGFDSQGSTYLDGVRDIGAQSREIFAVEQIQIVRGSDSTLGGRGSAGGSLNIISKVPRHDTFAGASISYGTDDYKRATVDLNFLLSDTVGVRLNALYHDQDVAGRDAIWQRRWGVSPALTIGLGTPTRLTAIYYHLHSSELPDSGIPYLYTNNNAPLGYSYTQPAGHFTTPNGVTGTVARTTFYGLTARDFRNTDTDQVTLRAEHDFGAVTLRNTARFSHNAQSYIYTQPDDQQGNVFGLATATANPYLQGGYVWRRANTRYGKSDALVDQLDLYGKVKTGILEHSFAVGAELSTERADKGIYLSQGSAVLSTGSTIAPRCNAATVARYYCTSAFSPNPSDPWVSYTSDTSNVVTPVVRSGPETLTISRGGTVGVYAFDSISIGSSLIVNLGLRWDRFTSQVEPGLPVGSTANRTHFKRSDSVLNGQAGLVYKPADNASIYASFATAATPPNSLLGEGQELNAVGSTVNLGGTQTAALIDPASLAVERTKSYEVGGKVDLFANALSLSAAVFRTETSNARVTGEDGLPAFAGKRRIQGVELGIAGNVTPRWSVFGGYTYLDAVIQDAGFVVLTAAAVPGQLAKTVRVPSYATGRQFPQTAKHSASVYTSYKITDRLSAGAGAYYVSRVFGGYGDNRVATQNAAGVVTVSPATRIVARTIPGYVRFDATAAYQFGDRVELRVNVQNLTDKVYYTQAYQNHYASIGAGRSAFATLSFKY